MLRSDYAQLIITGLLALNNRTWNQDLEHVDETKAKLEALQTDFPHTEIWLGFLTQNPTNLETGEGYQEPNDSEYTRIKLSSINRLNYQPYLLPPAVEYTYDDPQNPDTPTSEYAFVQNNGMILYQETTEDWPTVIGFGLFASNDPNEKPFLWGDVTDGSGNIGVTVRQNYIPVIREGGFKIMLK